MRDIVYIEAPYPVRTDIAEGQSRYWKKLAAPGTWLTGAQRVDIAKEIRQAGSCTLCSQRKAALSPYQVDGSHDTNSNLSDTMVEVVHRVVTDPACLTKSWFDGLIQQGLKVEEYVEIIGTLVHVLAIDEFCRGVGIPLNELPGPLPGKPSLIRPADANLDDDAWVPMVPDGPQPHIWGDEPVEANVIRAMSLVPA